MKPYTRVHFGSSEWKSVSTRWPPTRRLLQAKHTPIAICIITRAQGSYPFYQSMENGRLNRHRHCSEGNGVQPVFKAAYCGGVRERHKPVCNASSIQGPLMPQTRVRHDKHWTSTTPQGGPSPEVAPTNTRQRTLTGGKILESMSNCLASLWWRAVMSGMNQFCVCSRTFASAGVTWWSQLQR